MTGYVFSCSCVEWLILAVFSLLYYLFTIDVLQFGVGFSPNSFLIYSFIQVTSLYFCGERLIAGVLVSYSLVIPVL